MMMNTLERLLSAQVIERLGWTLIHFVWQGAVVALLLAITLRTLHKRSAAVRYIIACAALGLVVTLPLVTMPFVDVSGPTAEAGPVIAPVPVSKPLPIEVIEMAELSLQPNQASIMEITSPEIHVSWTQRAATALEPVLPYLVFGWLLGVFGLSTWHLGGWAQLQRMRYRMIQEVTAPLNTKLAQLAKQLSVTRTVGLFQSALVEVPTVVGWIKPVILLPASALSGLTAEQLEAILAHELAHIRRYDYLVNIVQTVVEILGFYHPGLWWISQKIRDERENCCDDLAVQVTGDSIRYARALTSLEEMRHRRVELAIAAGGGNLVGRIARLLGRPAPKRGRFTWLPGLIALILATLIVIPTALVLAAPEPAPLDIVEPAPPVQEDPEIEGQDRTQILIEFIIADIFADHVMDRETAEKAQQLLKRKPTDHGRRRGGALKAPNIEELQKPLGEVLANCFVSQGKGKDFLDLLASREHTSRIAAPSILQFAGEHGTIKTGDMEDPNGPFISLDILPNANGPENLSLIIKFDRRYPIFNEEAKPTPVTPSQKHAILTKDGQDSFINTHDLYLDAEGNKRLCALLVRPEIVSEPDEDIPTEPAGEKPTETATILASVENSKAAEAPDKPPVIVDLALILAKVQNKAVLDRETIETIANTLAQEYPEIRDEIQTLGSGPNVTLGYVLKTYVLGKPLTTETVGTLLSILESNRLIEIEAKPSIRGLNNKPSNISIGQEIPIQPGGDPNASPTYTDVGTFINVTPRLSPTADMAIVNMEITWSELAEELKPNNPPAITRKELSTQVAVPNDRFFSLLMDADNTSKVQDTDEESMIVLFRTQWDIPAKTKNIDVASSPTKVDQTSKIAQMQIEFSSPGLTCALSVEKGQMHKTTSEPSTIDSITGDITLQISATDPSGPAPCTIYLKDLSRTSGEERFHSDGPIRIKCGDLELTGNGLDLYFQPTPDLLDDVDTIELGTMRLQQAKNGSLVGYLHSNQQTQTEATTDSKSNLSIETKSENTVDEAVLQEIVDNFLGIKKNKAIILSDQPLTAPKDRTLPEKRSGWQYSDGYWMSNEYDPASEAAIQNISLNLEVMQVATKATLDQETAKKASAVLSTDTSQWSLNALRQYTVGQLLESVHQDVSVEQFKAFLALLDSRGYIDRIMAPYFSVFEGYPIRIGASDRNLRVVAERAQNNTAVRMDIDIDMDIRKPVLMPGGQEVDPEHAPMSVQTLQSRVIVMAKDKGFAVQPLGGLMTPDSTKAYYLLAYAEIIPPKVPVTVTATFDETNLLDALAEIGHQANMKIEPDITVKPVPVTAKLQNVTVPEALKQLLKGTGYQYLKTPDSDDYLIYRPISVTFNGDDLRQALKTISTLADVNITVAPEVSGRVYVTFASASLELALETILGGTPFIATATEDGYSIRDPKNAEVQPDKTKPNAVAVEAGFLLPSPELIETLQQGLSIEGITDIEDANALCALGTKMTPEKWLIIDDTQKSLLLRACRHHRDSKFLATPRVTVLADENTSFRLEEAIPYIAGYDEPNHASDKPLPKQATIRPGLAMEITPSFTLEDQIALNGSITFTHLLGFQKKLYQGELVYQIPQLDIQEIAIDKAQIDTNQTVLFYISSMNSSWIQRQSMDSKEAQPLLILMTPTKAHIEDLDKFNVPPHPKGFPPTTEGSLPDQLRPGMGGFGGFAPEAVTPMPSKR